MLMRVIIRQHWGEGTGRVKQIVALFGMYEQHLVSFLWEVRSLLVLGLFVGGNQNQQILHRKVCFRGNNIPLGPPQPPCPK